MKAVMDRIPEDVAALPVQDLDGREVRLSDLWRDQAAVLAFVRHFG